MLLFNTKCNLKCLKLMLPILLLFISCFSTLIPHYVGITFRYSIIVKIIIFNFKNGLSEILTLLFILYWFKL